MSKSSSDLDFSPGLRIIDVLLWVTAEVCERASAVVEAWLDSTLCDAEGYD